MRLHGAYRAGGNRLRLPTNIHVKGHTIVVQSGDPNSILMWTNWPWATWLKPQIDLAVALGANCITIKGPPGAALNNGLSQATVAANMRQLLDYTASLSLYFYACIAQGEGTSGQNLANVAFMAGVVAPYSHVIGIDAWNEINIFNTPASIPGGAAAVTAAVRSVTSIPVSVSVAVIGGGSSTNLAAVAPYCDYLDFHPYGDPNTATTVDLSSWRSQSWWKQFIIGEISAPISGNTTTQQTSLMNHFKLYGDQPDSFGVIGFSVVDFDANQYGFYDTVPGGTLRTQVSTPYAAWPKHA